ncbi:MAG: DMT family transporter [Candidatus Dormibacteria bacterium]
MSVPPRPQGLPLLVGFVLLIGIASGLQQFLLGVLARGGGALRAAMLSASVSVALLAVLLLARAARRVRGRKLVAELALVAVLAAAAIGFILVGGLGHPWYLYAAGAFGLMVVGGLAYSVPRLGTGPAITLLVAGQMAVSLLLDQIGLLGLARMPLSPLRFLGALLLLSGVVLILRKEHA